MIFQQDIDRIMRELGVEPLKAYRMARAQHEMRSRPEPLSTNWIK